MTKQINIEVQFLFSGYSDYWSGDGERWDKDNGCLFAYYNQSTSFEDLREVWIDEFNHNGEFDDSELAENVSDDDLREALKHLMPYHEGEIFDDEAIVKPGEEQPVAIILVKLSEQE